MAGRSLQEKADLAGPCSGHRTCGEAGAARGEVGLPGPEAKPDSVQLDLGMATPPQATVDSAKGTAFHALLGPTGRVLSMSMDKPGLLASQAEGLLKTFHPRVKRGARPGETWADTIEVDSHSAQANTRTNTVTTFTMGGAEAWEGVPATRLDATFTGTVTGTLITPARSADMDGKNTGTAIMYLGRDGRYLGGTSTTAGDA